MKEQAAWNNQLILLGLSSNDLFYKSNIDLGRRVYLKNGYIYKITIKTLETTSYKRKQDLKGEYEILQKIQHIHGAPKVIKLIENTQAKVLIEKRILGIPLSEKEISGIGSLYLLIKLFNLLFRISVNGVSHNDIIDNNILVNENYDVYLVDFDQSTYSSAFKAFKNNFLGLGNDSLNSYVSIIKVLLKKRMPKFIKILLKSFVNLVSKSDQKLPKDVPEGMNNLVLAWKIAQRSNASSPNKQIAYYSLNVDGYHFPGERPWYDRWCMVRDITDYKNKRILELGCNLSLLSCHLLKESKASFALATDFDLDILKAAKLVANYYKVDVTYRQIDYDKDLHWDKELIDFHPDVVFALNVLNWLSDKERFLRFLSNFQEIIFEGHDDLVTELDRLNNVGFSDITIVGKSERNREILYCKI